MSNQEPRISAALKKIGCIRRVRDPIYGFIMLSDAEEQIIDTLLFQRLRRIHQLALAYDRIRSYMWTLRSECGLV
jgi:hypothetical protein